MGAFIYGLIITELILFLILWFFVNHYYAWISLYVLIAIFGCIFIWSFIKSTSLNSITSGLLPPEVAAFMISVFGDRIVDSTTGLINSIQTLPDKVAILSYIGIFLIITLPYIVLIAVIIIIYYACTDNKKSNKKDGGGKQRNYSFISPDTRMKLYSINPFGTSQPTIPRPIIHSGRCDNLSFFEDSSEGQQGHCEVSQIPDDIVWTIDESQLPEYVSLPSDLQKKLTPKLTIRIPYTKNPEESFFVPQCDKATYADNTPVKLYNDLGMSCSLNQPSIINATKTEQDQTKGYYV
jgi:hypothetical protein